jgi:hypothetical protein
MVITFVTVAFMVVVEADQVITVRLAMEINRVAAAA